MREVVRALLKKGAIQGLQKEISSVFLPRNKYDIRIFSLII